MCVSLDMHISLDVYVSPTDHVIPDDHVIQDVATSSKLTYKLDVSNIYAVAARTYRHIHCMVSVMVRSPFSQIVCLSHKYKRIATSAYRD